MPRSRALARAAPSRKNLAFDMIAQACGGTFSVTGDAGWPADPARASSLRRHRYRHADGDHHSRRAVTSSKQTGEGHRLQVAMQDAMLHYMRGPNFATQGPNRQGGRARRRAGCPASPTPRWACTPARPAGPTTIRLRHDQPRQSGALGPAADAGRARGPDRRRTLSWYPGRPGGARTGRGSPKSSPPGPEGPGQVRGHGSTSARRAFPPGAVLDSHDELHDDATFEQRGVMQTMRPSGP